VGAVLVVAKATLALSACYMAQASAEVNDRKLTEDTLTQRMLITQAHAITMVSDHTAAERAAGRLMPYSSEELRVLDTLLRTQRDLAKRSRTPLPNPFAGAVDSASSASERIATIGMDLGIAAAAAGGLYLLTR
jgi:hypothetical protein